MIIDRIDHRFLYQGLPGRIPAALDFLQRTDFDQQSPGRLELDGDKMFAIISDYQPKSRDIAVWESHRAYIDVQFMAKGTELMGWAPSIPGLPVKTPYDESRDVVFYEPGLELITMHPGQFAIFFPHDIHAPGIDPLAGSTSMVRKIVVKVAVGA